MTTHFGARLRKLRGNDTLENMANLLDCSITTVHDVERGRRAVSVPRAYLWETILKETPGSLIALLFQDELDSSEVPFDVKLEPKRPT
jgi:transcriptional regulator with XRE-family HTH domain